MACSKGRPEADEWSRHWVHAREITADLIERDSLGSQAKCDTFLTGIRLQQSRSIAVSIQLPAVVSRSMNALDM